MCRINRRGPVFGDSVKYSSIVISKNETERNSTSGKEVTDRSVYNVAETYKLLEIRTELNVQMVRPIYE